MTREKFDQLVPRIEHRFKSRPRALRMVVMLWAILGFAWFSAWIALVLLLAGGIAAIGVTCGPEGWFFYLIASVVLVVGISVVSPVLWVRLPEIQGRRISPKEAPALFAMLVRPPLPG